MNPTQFLPSRDMTDRSYAGGPKTLLGYSIGDHVEPVSQFKQPMVQIHQHEIPSIDVSDFASTAYSSHLTHLTKDVVFSPGISLPTQRDVVTTPSHHSIAPGSLASYYNMDTLIDKQRSHLSAVLSNPVTPLWREYYIEASLVPQAQMSVVPLSLIASSDGKEGMRTVMARRFRPRSTPRENIGVIFHSFPWKVLLILPIFVVLVIPTYEYGSHVVNGVIPGLTKFFYTLANTSPQPTPIPIPAFPRVLPQVGSITATVDDGSSCDELLVFQMRMADAGQVFSDAQESTVQALDKSIGQDCHKLQPGMQLKLSPQYPLVALGGEILQINSSSPQQAVPTPLIQVPQDPNQAPDCSGGCNLTVQISAGAQVHLAVDTMLAMHKGDWVWFQAMLPRQKIKGFDAYPYADPHLSFNGMSLQACDFQVNTIHDNDSLPCDQLNPNTIQDDGGAWLFAATGASGLDHWHYRIHASAGTQLLVWLTLDDNGNLTYNPGDPVYRYNSATHLYVKL